MTQTEIDVLRRVVTALGSAIVAASMPHAAEVYRTMIASDLQAALTALKDLEPRE